MDRRQQKTRKAIFDAPHILSSPCNTSMADGGNCTHEVATDTPLHVYQSRIRDRVTSSPHPP